MTSHTNAQRDALVKQLDSSLARLDRLGGALRSQLAATTDPSQQSPHADTPPPASTYQRAI